MKAIRSVLQVAGVLLSLWLVLAVIGLVAGVIPLPGVAASAGGEDAGVDAAAADAGVADAGAAEPVDAGVDAPLDAGAPVEQVSTPMLPRLRVCDEAGNGPSLVALDVIGDGAPEIVVGCGTHWEVLALRGSGAGIEAWRVARIDPPPSEREIAPFAGPLAVGDVDGDGARDLIAPFARFGAGGATRGGGVYVVLGDAFGAFASARALAPIAAVAAQAMDLDGAPGADLAVMDQTSAFARLPSELWAFRGGPSPMRSAVARIGIRGAALGVVDLDLDGHDDVVSVSTDDARADVHYGDGAGAFPRTDTLAVESGIAVAIGDLDGDAHADALLEGSALSALIASTEAASRTPRAIEMPAGFRAAQILDVDADGAAEIVGWAHPALVVLTRAGDTWTSAPRVELAAGSTFGPRRSVMTDLDSDGAPELVLLGVTATDGPRSFELVVIPGTERGVITTGDQHEVSDAPLTLRIALPEAQAI